MHGEVELLSSILDPGGVSRAAAVIDHFGDLRALVRADEAELCRVRGVGPARARRLVAALKLGTLALHAAPSPHTIDSAEAAYAVLAPRLLGLGHEELHALYLDRRLRPLGHRVLTVGSSRFTVVDPIQILRPAVSLDASALVLAHNHPSGDPTPSAQDVEVTRRVVAAGRTLGVAVVDHLVVAAEGYRSLRERGVIDGACPVAASWTA